MMDTKEYSKKYDAIASSAAEPSVKAEALAKLNEQYYGAPRRALQLINESAPELPKGVD
jgi:hypothetical protein